MLAENLNLFQAENVQDLQGFDPKDDPKDNLEMNQSIMQEPDK